MVDFYIQSDIAISAGGSSCYELAYFGIPNIIITIAENQENIALELDRINVSMNIGTKDTISSKEFKDKFLDILNDSSKRKDMIRNGMNLIDGLGKKRIVDCMNTFK
jgi:spore coat polysaccharide biosynthesis predicted glycosyltransferase SpsG